MELVQTRFGDIDLSHEWREFYRKEVEEKIGNALREHSKKTGVDITELIDGRVNSILELNLQNAGEYLSRCGIKKPKSVRMLMAHGDSWIDKDGSKFVYVDINQDNYKEIKEVQKWVNEHDGRYGALFVTSCNPKGVEINSQRSFLIYPTKINNSKEIMWASLGINNDILTIKPPKSYSGRPSILDPMEQFLSKMDSYLDK